MNNTEYINELVDLQFHANKQNIKLDVILMGDAFYEQHKNDNGSYRNIVRTPEYKGLMSTRYESSVDKCWEVYCLKVNAIQQYNKLDVKKHKW